VKPITVKQVLQDALALIKIGWTRGREKRRRGDRVSYCITGAVKAATPNGELRSGANARLRVVTSLSTYEALFEWNDKPGRTKAEVVAAFERAIEAARTNA
jgi:hypothetical protein